MAATGGNDEPASLIAEGLPSGLEQSCITEMGFEIGAVGDGKLVGVGRIRLRGCSLEFGSVLVLAGVIEMTFDGGRRQGRVLGQCCCCEAGEIVDVTEAKSFGEGGDGWAAKGGVAERDEVGWFRGSIDGKVGCVVDRCDGHVDLPELVGGGRPRAVKNDVVVVGNGDSCVGECSRTAVVAELSYAEKRG